MQLSLRGAECGDDARRGVGRLDPFDDEVVAPAADGDLVSGSGAAEPAGRTADHVDPSPWALRAVDGGAERQLGCRTVGQAERVDVVEHDGEVGAELEALGGRLGIGEDVTEPEPFQGRRRPGDVAAGRDDDRVGEPLEVHPHDGGCVGP